MASVINTNMASLTAQRNLSNSQNAQTDAMARLSSGLRINSAKDDAAGLAISTRFSSQTQGLAVAIRNAGDGISLAQTAEGALGTMTESLQRVRELALQAANGTNSDTDREALNAEAKQMIAEITRTAEETNFNGQKLLNGDFNTQFQIGANAGETIGVNIASVNVDQLGVSSKSGVSAVGNSAALGNGDLIINGVSINSSSAADDDASTNLKASSAIAKVEAINKHSAETGVTAVIDENVAAGSTQSAQAITGGSISLNGVSIDVDTTGDEATTRAAVAAAINAESERTGVTAVDSGDKSTGVSLVAEDGRNIELTFGSGTDGTGAPSSLTSANTGLTSSGTFTGGYTLVAEGDTKEIKIEGGNNTGNGSLANSGLSQGTYGAGISAVSSSAKVGEAFVEDSVTHGTLDLSSLKGVDFSAPGASKTISVNVDGEDYDLTVNGDFRDTSSQGSTDIDLSSVYGNDYTQNAGTFSIDIDGGDANGGSTVQVALNNDYSQVSDSQNGGLKGIQDSFVNALSGTQRISVDGVDVDFQSTGLTGKTGDDLATALQAAINSGIDNIPSGTRPEHVTVKSDGNGELTIDSGKRGGTVADVNNPVSGAVNDTFGTGTSAVATKIIETQGALVLDGTDTVANNETLIFNVDGEDVTVTFDGTDITVGSANSRTKIANAITAATGVEAAVSYDATKNEVTITSDSLGNQSKVKLGAGTGVDATGVVYSSQGAAIDSDIMRELQENATSTPAVGASGTVNLSDLIGTDFSGTGNSQTISVKVDGQDYDVTVDGNLSGSAARSTVDLDLSAVYGKDFSGTNNGGEFTITFTDGAGVETTQDVALTGDYRQDSVFPGIAGITRADLANNTTGENVVVQGINIDLTYDPAFNSLTDDELRAQVETDLNDSISTYNNNNGLPSSADVSNVAVKLADNGTFSIESTSITGTVASGTALSTGSATSPEPKSPEAKLSFEATTLLDGGVNALADTNTVAFEINGATFTFAEDSTLSTTVADLATQLGSAVASGGAAEGIADGTTLTDYLATLGPNSGIGTDGDNIVVTAGTKTDGTVSTMDDSALAVTPAGYIEADQVFSEAQLTDTDLLAELNAVLVPAGTPIGQVDGFIEVGTAAGTDGKFTLLGSATGGQAAISVADGDDSNDKKITGVGTENYSAGADGVTDQDIVDALNLGANSDKFEFLLDGNADDGSVIIRSLTTGPSSTISVNTGGTAGIVSGDFSNPSPGQDEVLTGGLGQASLSFMTDVDSGNTNDAKFNLRSQVAGESSGVTVTAGTINAAGSNTVQGLADSITDEVMLEGIDFSTLSGKAELVDDLLENDGNVTFRSTTIGDQSTIAVNDSGTAGITSTNLGTPTTGDATKAAQERDLDAGDLVVNNVAIKAAQSSDDVASYSDAESSSKTASGIAVAKAINKSTGETGVTADVNATEYVGGSNTTEGTIGSTGAVWVNGVEVSLTTQSGAGANRAHAADQINAVSGQTGVTASDNGNSLTLTGADGRNIVLAFDTDKGNGTTAASDFGLGKDADDATGTAISESNIASKADADADAKTTYSTVSLTGAGDIEVSAGINGTEKLDSLGLKAGTFGGGEDGTFLKDIDLSTVEGATAALSAIDNALDSVNSQRAELGAIQNRFETTVKNLQVSSENLTAANSRIRDADFAAETAELSRAQVLQQAGTSILAQANALPQQVLSLLQ